MPDPVDPQRPRALIGVPLAIMVLACALIVLALLLVAQGALAADAPCATRLAEHAGLQAAKPAEGAASTPGAGAPRPETPRATDVVDGRFDLSRAPSPREHALAARIATSSSGGGVVVGDEMRVMVRARPASSAPSRR